MYGLSGVLAALALTALACSETAAPLSADANVQLPGEPDATPICTAERSDTFYADKDGDGFGDPNLTAVDCAKPDGFVENSQDCNDRDSRDNPDGIELCDGLDNDCNPATLETCANSCSPQFSGDAVYLYCAQALSFSAASIACQAEDMHLVRIDDLDEHTFLADQRLVAFGSRPQTWIGASDSTTEDTWIWTDNAHFWQGRANGAAVDGLFTNWRGGEPNDDGTEDCGVLHDSAGGQWNDRECGATLRFICERNADPGVAP